MAFGGERVISVLRCVPRSVSRAMVARIFCVAIGFALAPASALSADTPLSTQIKGLTAAVGNDAANDAEAQTALAALLTKLGQTNCAQAPADNVDCKVRQIRAFADAAARGFAQSSLTETQNNDLWAALTKVLTVAVKEPTKSPVNRDTTIINALKLIETALNPEMKLNEPEAVSSELATVNHTVALRGADVSANAVIRVDGAWFGDLNAIRHALARNRSLSPWEAGYRFCSATRAIRAICQHKPQCYEPVDSGASGAAKSETDGSPDDITGAKLCGYEPAPFADPRIRGLIVRFRCFDPADPELSTLVANDDLISPPVVTTDAADRDAQLRVSAITGIRCSSP